jgi:hypothetical protein
VFDIITSDDFLVKLEADYADFKTQPDSARHALNCIITAYHLHEWVWGDWLKADKATQQELGINGTIASFEAWLERTCPDFGVVEKLTNGAKHFVRATAETTKRTAGWGEAPWGVAPWGQPCLLIDSGSDLPDDKRYQTAEQLLDDVVTFWRAFFKRHRPTRSGERDTSERV